MKTKHILYSILIFSILVGCSRKRKESNHFETNSNVKYAKNFSIKINKNYIEFHLLNPETNEIEKKFALIKNDSIKVPEGFTPILVPIKSTITLSSTHIGMLSKLNACNLVKGISNHNYVYEPSILERYKKGEVIELGDENSISVESIIRSQSDLLIYSGFGKEFPHQKQLEKLGTICLANYDWKENHPLGKAEWIKVFGYLTGKEEIASIYFKAIEKDYLSLKKMASKLKDTPSLFSGNLVGDIWYSPAGESYNAILFKDAKGDYKYANSKGIGSIENSFEQIFSDNLNTQYWFNPGIESKQDLLKSQPKFKLFQAYKENKIFSYTFSGNEFWERSAVEPNHVLSDLIRILHPELKLKNKLYFYRTLSK